MTQKDEPLRMAIEFIEETATFVPHSFDLNGIAVVNACKAALSADKTILSGEQGSEPVAWALFYENGVVNHVTKTVHPTMNGSHLKYKPLFTAPPKREWRGLSDEVIEELCDKHFDDIQTLLYEYQNKLKEVNGYD